MFESESIKHTLVLHPQASPAPRHAVLSARKVGGGVMTRCPQLSNRRRVWLFLLMFLRAARVKSSF